MAFPAVESITTSSTASNSTSHTIDMPATVVSGELLLALVANNGGEENLSTPSGWTVVDDQTSYSGILLARISDGTEGGTTVSINTDTSEKIAAAVFRISGWSGTIADIETAFVAGPNSATVMPTLAPSHGSDDYLWLIFRSAANSGITVSSWPTNYTSNQTRVESTGGGTSSHAVVDCATRELAASSESPGTWTFSANYGTSNGCWLIAIRPDQGGGPVAQDFPFRRYYQGGLAL